jgi:GntR family phosphonate transport system transcriptional regulator
VRPVGIVVWQKIAETLAEEIGSGLFSAGSRLPVEAALAARFSVNRHTLRRAIAALAEAGLVTVHQGRGTFVKAAPMVEYHLGRRTRFSDILSRQSRLSDGELLAASSGPADTDLAASLALDTGAPLISLEVLRRADGTPISIVTHHFPADRFAGIDEAYRRVKSITRALRDFGVEDYMRRTTRIWARMPVGKEAGLLSQSASRPVLITEALNVDMAGTPIEYGIARASAERLQVVVET